MYEISWNTAQRRTQQTLENVSEARFASWRTWDRIPNISFYEALHTILKMRYTSLIICDMTSHSSTVQILAHIHTNVDFIPKGIYAAHDDDDFQYCKACA
ncbi:hypothetical protein AF72_09320 [Xylella taiwanensis]|uniref:Uncharacterized protein n=1 Tax=Xylella taiwanensis TaxID=1444770 RepID=Z9JJ07_9GAMM|nr:hypothetical protein AB672_10190 [Xylella taiwanensis]EWS77742.1 hypothetical protein AF72_09320 [Xylella taiwanensis]